MPWWFWIITHLWVFCSTLLLLNGVENEEPWWMITITTLFSLPILVIAVIVVGYSEYLPKKHKKKIENNWLSNLFVKILKWIWKKMKRPILWMGRNLIKRPLKWFVGYKKRREDFKNIKENEDTWEAERVGIRVKD